MGGIAGNSADINPFSRRLLGMDPVKVLNIDPPKPPEQRHDLGYGESVSPPNRSHIIERAKYQQALRQYNVKQTSAAVQYSNLWESDPRKFIETLDRDLAAGKITQEYYDQQFQNKDKKKFKAQVESQAAAKAAQEKKLAQQREAAKQVELAAQRSAQQQRTLQNLEVDQEGESATVVSKGGSAPTGATGGRRRRGARLSAVLGI